MLRVKICKFKWSHTLIPAQRRCGKSYSQQLKRVLRLWCVFLGSHPTAHFVSSRRYWDCFLIVICALRDGFFWRDKRPLKLINIFPWFLYLFSANVILVCEVYDLVSTVRCWMALFYLLMFVCSHRCLRKCTAMTFQGNTFLHDIHAGAKLWTRYPFHVIILYRGCTICWL